MNVLVTGGAGFLGTHLCERLLKEGHSVVCLDNLSSGDLSNVVRLSHWPEFSFVEQDVEAPMDLCVEQIYHLACPASPLCYLADPVRTVRTCVLGALNVLDLARRTEARILLASASEVYGHPQLQPFVESYRGSVDVAGSRACLAEGKRVSETLFSDYQNFHGVDIRIARLFNTYGPRMKVTDGRVIPHLIVRALKGLPLPIRAYGLATRTFCYVTDVIDGMMAMMRKPRVAGPLNLGSTTEVTIMQLAQWILNCTGSQSEIRFVEESDGALARVSPDISAAAAVLGWKPRIPLEEGLQYAIEYFRRHLAKAASRLGGEYPGENSTYPVEPDVILQQAVSMGHR